MPETIGNVDYRVAGRGDVASVVRIAGTHSHTHTYTTTRRLQIPSYPEDRHVAAAPLWQLEDFVGSMGRDLAAMQINYNPPPPSVSRYQLTEVN